jgi:predicted porin
MKKSLVALAVASAFAAPAAFADVTISGAINVGLMYTSDTDGTDPASQGFSQSNLANNYSNFNISSVDDIGGGNQVVLNIQTAVGLSDTGSALGNRNSYLGIKGGWGGLYWGTNENIYEQYMYESDPLDGAVGLGGNLSLLGTPGAATVFDVGQGTSDAGFYRRTDNTIWYASPNWSGISFGGALTLNAHRTSASSSTPRMYSLGVQYKPDGGPFFVNAAYESHEDLCGIEAISPTSAPANFITNVAAVPARNTDCKDTGIQFGGGVTLGEFTITARYEMLEYKGNSATTGDLSKYERDAVWVGLKFNLASGYIGAVIGQAMDADCVENGGTCDGSATGATLLGAGYFHNLSKQSQLQIIVSSISNDAEANYVFAGGPANANNVNGADHKGLYLGIKHVF